MYIKTHSSNLFQIESADYNWPETTKPFVFATKLVGTGDYAHIEHYVGENGLDMMAYVAAGKGAVLSVLCCLAEDKTWTTKRVLEMLLGTLGGVQIAVFRDEDGREFCPDAPLVPADRVGNLVSMAIVVGAERTRPQGLFDAGGSLIEADAAVVPAV